MSPRAVSLFADCSSLSCYVHSQRMPKSKLHDVFIALSSMVSQITHALSIYLGWLQKWPKKPGLVFSSGERDDMGFAPSCALWCVCLSQYGRQYYCLCACRVLPILLVTYACNSVRKLYLWYAPRLEYL